MKIPLLILFFCSVYFGALAQTDTVPRQDTPVTRKQDSVRQKPDSVRATDTVRRVPVVRDTTATRATTRDSAAKPAAPKTEVRLPDTTEPATTEVAAVRNQIPERTVKGKLLPGYVADSLPNISRINLSQAVLRQHPYYKFFDEPMAMAVQEKKVNGRESIFYFMVGLMLYFGFIRLAFGKYLDNLVTLFFRATMRQQQLRDQLLQSPLPSLFMNLLFFVNGGFFIAMLARHYNVVPITNQWLLFGYCSALLMLIYLGKFIVLKLAGWIFNVTQATDTYIFIVFLVNKMIGIFLLPVLVVMAFAGPALFEVVMTLAFLVLVIFYIYRFIISYKPIRNEIKLSRLHFFIYLCAFEIAPLLLIYKVLLIFVERVY